MPIMEAETSTFLPTITSVYAAVEDYLVYLADAGEGIPSAPPVTVQPIDALLIALMAAYQPGRPHVVDLASEATCGASTVLCSTIPAVHSVAVAHSPPSAWRFAMTRYLRDLHQPLAEILEVEDDVEALRAVAHPQTPLLVLAAPRADAVAVFGAAVERWLAHSSRTLLLVLDVGETGVCPILAALSAGSSGRLALLRERAPALAGSRLAVVGHHADVVLEQVLFRIGRLFNDHFQYLEMVKRACLSALDRVPEDDPSLRVGEFGQHSEHTEPDSMRVLRRTLEERTGELQELRNSLAVRLVTRMRRMARLLAPPGSPQRWLALKARAGARRLLRGRRALARPGS
jgi:hypothetical protein